MEIKELWATAQEQEPSCDTPSTSRQDTAVPLSRTAILSPDSRPLGGSPGRFHVEWPVPRGHYEYTAHDHLCASSITCYHRLPWRASKMSGLLECEIEGGG